jgi:hypothetical protein
MQNTKKTKKETTVIPLTSTKQHDEEASQIKDVARRLVKAVTASNVISHQTPALIEFNVDAVYAFLQRRPELISSLSEPSEKKVLLKQPTIAAETKPAAPAPSAQSIVAMAKLEVVQYTAQISLKRLEEGVDRYATTAGPFI